MPTIADIKELAQANTPIVVFDLTFPDGTLKYFATHAVTFNTHVYEARVLTHNISGVQSMNETGLDLPPTAQFELADADTEMTQLQNTLGFKGAAVVATFFIMNVATQLPASSDSLVRFVGTCNAPQDMSENGSRGPSVTITAQNQLTAQRQQIPPDVLGRLCFHDYPVTAAQRLDGAVNRNSPNYGCGYSPDVTPLSSQPVGSLVAGIPAVTCNHSRQNCIINGMFYCDTATTLAANCSIGATSVSLTADIAPTGTDIVIGGNPDPTLGMGELVAITGKSGAGPYTYNFTPALKHAHSSGANVGRYTARFSGNEFVPISYLVKPYGGKSEQAAVANAQYGDAIPQPYGHVWVNAKITALRSDGNNQRLECVVSLGQIDSIVRVIVNGYELPRGAGQGGTGNTTSGWYDILTMGSRTGGFDLENFTDSAGNPQGDPYGSMAALSIVCPKAIASGPSYPQVRVELTGRQIEGFDGAGASTGWAYRTDPCLVFIDMLKMCRFPLSLIDTAYVTNTSSPVCDEVISTLDDFGQTVDDQRFHFAYVFDTQIPGANALQGIRNSARLYVNWVASKLQVHVENTIANEQPTKPTGSNATGTIAGGWPAYVFNESNILRVNGKSSFRRYFKEIPQTQTHISFNFFDQWNGYVQDTFNLNDTDEQQLAGFEVPASSLVFGCPAWDQSARVGAFMLAKSVAGNDFVELISSVKVSETQLGQIIAINYVKEGMTNFLYRIIKIEPSQNFRQSKITLQFHDDAWYADTYGGTSRAPIGKPWFDRGARAPWPVKGNVSPPVSGNVLDAAVYDTREIIPHVSAESVITNADGSITIQLTVTAAGPPMVCSPTVQPPIIDAQCTLFASGGALLAGAEYYAVASVDADGFRSHRSTTAVAIIPSGSVNRAEVTGISLPTNAASMVVYRGRTPQTMIGTAVATAATFMDDGSALGWSESPYDPFYDHTNLYWRNVDGPSLRVASTATNLSSSTTIGNTTKTWTVNQYTGSIVEIIRGTGAGQRRYVTSNTATTLTVPTWQVTPGVTSVFCIYSLATSATATTVTDSTQAYGTLTNKSIKVIDGTGRYQERRVVSNTGTQITIDAPWDTIPDTTSAFEIVDSSWNPGTIGTSVYGGTPLASSVQGLLNVPNVTNALIEFACVGADAQQQESMLSLGTYARYCVAGNNPMPAAGSVTGFSVSEVGIVGSDGTLASQLTATFTAPSPLGTFAGVELYIQGDGASGHYGANYSFIASGPASPITITLPASGESATITAFSYNTDGTLNTASGQAVSVVLNGQTSAPNSPTNLTESTGILMGGQVLLAWDANSTNKDLASFDIARRYDATTPTAADIIFTGQSAYQNPVTRKQTYIDTPGANAATARYYVRWVNSTGLVSSFTGPAAVTALAPDGSTDYGTTDAWYQWAAGLGNGGVGPFLLSMLIRSGSTIPAGNDVLGGIARFVVSNSTILKGGSPASPTTPINTTGIKTIHMRLYYENNTATVPSWGGGSTATLETSFPDDGSIPSISNPKIFDVHIENVVVTQVDFWFENYYGIGVVQSLKYSPFSVVPAADEPYTGFKAQSTSTTPASVPFTIAQAYGASRIKGNTSTNIRDSGSSSDVWQEKNPINLSASDGCVLEVNGSTANGDLFTTDSGAAYRLPIGTTGQILAVDTSQPGKMKWATGPATSVAANKVYAGPTSGGSATPTFRSLVSTDIPDLSAIYAALGGSPMFTAGIDVSGGIGADFIITTGNVTCGGTLRGATVHSDSGVVSFGPSSVASITIDHGIVTAIS